MAGEITFIVEFRCPRCDAVLESRSGGESGWQRCPRCGRAVLPPEHMRARTPKDRELEGDEILVIGPEPAGVSPPRRSPFPPGSFRRIICASGLFLSLLIALVSLLEHDSGTAWIFTLIALPCLALAVLPARERRM